MSTTAAEALCLEKATSVNPLSLRRNFSWVTLANAVDTIAQWLRVVVLLHLGGEVMVGTLAMAFAVCVPVYGLANLDLGGALATDAKHQYRFGDYLGLRLATSLLAFLLIAGVVLAAGYRAEASLLVLLVAFGEVVRAAGEVFHALQQKNERMDRLAISQMIRGPAGVAALALGVWWTGSLAWGVAGFVVVGLATLFLYDVPNGRRLIRAINANHRSSPHAGPTCTDGLRPRWDGRTMLRLAKLTFPMGVVVAIVALQVSVPRYMVDYFLGKHALGVFVSLWYLTVVGSRVARSLGQSSAPRLAKYYAAEDRSAFLRLLGKLTLLVVALGAAAVLGTALVGRPVLGLLYKPEFTRYVNLAVWLMAAGAVGYLAYPAGFALIAMRRLKTHMAMRGVAIGTLLVASLILVPRHGLYGIAFAILTSGAAFVLGSTVVVLQSLRRMSAVGGAAEEGLVSRAA